MTRRYYSSTAAPTTLAASATSGTTTLTVAAVSGWPSSTPYTLLVDPDTVNEELVEVTGRSGTTLTVTRGVDGTSGVAHDSGAVVRHAFSARDLDEPNSHVNASAAVHGLTGTVVGTSDTQTLTNKTISGASNTLSSIAQSSVTSLTSDLAAKAPLAATVSAKTDSYTLVAGDNGSVITINKASATNLTVPSGLSAGFTVLVAQIGAGQVTLVASGTTVNATPGLKLRTQYSAVTLVHLGSDVWLASGDLSA